MTRRYALFSQRCFHVKMLMIFFKKSVGCTSDTKTQFCGAMWTTHMCYSRKEGVRTPTPLPPKHSGTDKRMLQTNSECRHQATTEFPGREAWEAVGEGDGWLTSWQKQGNGAQPRPREAAMYEPGARDVYVTHARQWAWVPFRGSWGLCFIHKLHFQHDQKAGLKLPTPRWLTLFSLNTWYSMAKQCYFN